MEDIALTNSLLEATEYRTREDSTFDTSIHYSNKNRTKTISHIIQQQQQQNQKPNRRNEIQVANSIAEQSQSQILNTSDLTYNSNNNKIEANYTQMYNNRSSFKVCGPHSLTPVLEMSSNSLKTSGNTSNAAIVNKNLSHSITHVNDCNNNNSLNHQNYADKLAENNGAVILNGSISAILSDKHSSAEQITEPVEQNSLVEEKSRVRITSRIVFLKVGQVDTRNERFDAEAYIECTWEDDQIFKILADPNMAKNLQNPNAIQTMLKQAETATLSRNNLINLKNIINNISVLEYDANLFWSPQLYIENAIGDLKEEVRHKLEIVEKDGYDLLSDPNFNSKDPQYKQLMSNLTVRVCEMRKCRGVFYERLELYDFPMDTQELSVTLTSKRNAKEVEFVENDKDPCSINTEDFLDQQEWDLFGHVTTTKKTIFDPWRKYERAGFAVTCFIARKPGYYLYNAYMLVFLITALGFVPFAFDPGAPQFRCQVTGLLLLTSVNFRWIVTQRLPSVAYLTSLDKYAIGSLLCLVLFCVWHSLIGSTIITGDADTRKSIDLVVLIASATFYLLYNLFCIGWFMLMYRSIKIFQNESEVLASAAANIRNENKRRKEAEQLEMNTVSTYSVPPQPLKQLTATAATLNEQTKRPSPSPTMTAAIMAAAAGSGSAINSNSSSTKSRNGRQTQEP